MRSAIRARRGRREPFLKQFERLAEAENLKSKRPFHALQRRNDENIDSLNRCSARYRFKNRFTLQQKSIIRLIDLRSSSYSPVSTAYQRNEDMFPAE
ncbi:hypothetical protein TNCV_2727781 [Trichonephila clavipes]|nr:hypothetical protein TNCV_2727781 [Trichonephila clavipes]